jgi:hypothetical protein
MMQRVALTLMVLALSACANNLESNAQCLRTAGCTSSFPNSGYGPIHAQAAGPDAAPVWQPPN